MNVNEYLGTKSNFLKAEHLTGPRTFTIQSALPQELQFGERIVLSFADDIGVFPLNVTNLKAIMALHGPETGEWIGKAITLYPTKVEFQGEMVPAVRVRSSD